MNDSGRHAERISVEVVKQVAAAQEVDPLDLPPLGDVIDLESLDNLLDKSPAAIRLEWTVDDVCVEVTSDGTVQVTTPSMR